MKKSLEKYLTQEAMVGIKKMCKNRSPLHVFDIGKFEDGKEYSFLMQIIPKIQADAMGLVGPGEEDAYDRMCHLRDEESLKRMVGWVMAQSTSLGVTHIGMMAAMFESVKDLAEELDMPGFSSVQAKFFTMITPMVDLAKNSTEEHIQFEYHLNRWLFNKKEEHFTVAKAIASKNPGVRDFLLSRTNTAELVEDK